MCIKQQNNNLIVKSTKKKQTKVNRIDEQDSVEKSKEDLALMKKIENSKVHSSAYAKSEYKAYQSSTNSLND